MTSPPGPYVAVCGPGVATERENGWAEQVGRLVAQAGAVIVCGGVSGVMDAVARGAAVEGGTSIGILPGRDRTEASPALTYSIPTGMGETRNALVVRAADVLIAVAGEFGTLSEIALALKMGVPVVGLHTWYLAKHGEAVKAFPSAESAEEAVRLALRLAGGGRSA
jgi:uncharacterized protein (TIGR00725 family)